MNTEVNCHAGYYVQDFLCVKTKCYRKSYLKLVCMSRKNMILRSLQLHHKLSDQHYPEETMTTEVSFKYVVLLVVM
jgi:hypothetical protein